MGRAGVCVEMHDVVEGVGPRPSEAKLSFSARKFVSMRLFSPSASSVALGHGPRCYAFITISEYLRDSLIS